MAANVGYGSTLTITNIANVNVLGDLKLGTTVVGSSGTANQSGGTLAVTGVDTADGNRSLVIGEYSGETLAIQPLGRVALGAQRLDVLGL